MQIDNFAHKSKSWDMSSKRVKNAESIAKGILKNIKTRADMTLMDFGAGTGLLSYFIAPSVEKIVAVDNSPSMLEMFREKQNEFDCHTELIQADLSTQNIDHKFDGIISSMTIHHVEDTQDLLQKFYDLLNKNGTIGLADLETEDGSFHTDDTGVFHFGFDKAEFLNIAKKVGFKDLKIETISVSSKPHGEYPIFLLTGRK